jgi:hypothetical protein
LSTSSEKTGGIWIRTAFTLYINLGKTATLILRLSVHERNLFICLGP